MTQHIDSDPQARKPGERLLAHLAFEEEAIGPTLLEWETWLLDA